MKKTLIAIFILLLAGLISIYVLIPENIKVSKVLAVNASILAGTRIIMDSSQWQYWWPKDSTTARQSKSLTWGNAVYRPTKALFNGYAMETSFQHVQIEGQLIYAQLGLDSMAIFWNYQLASGWNPMKRISAYFFMKSLKENIATPLNALKTFLESKKQVYGMEIVQDMVKDTILVSTKKILPGQPDQATIIGMIQQLKDYAKQTGAKQTGFPMLNITVLDSTHYQTMVAIPVDKQIPQTSVFSWKRMVAGKILIGEITGGPYRAENAMKQMHLYVQDYHITSPAIPFYSLVTDRGLEKDSTKWITRIYYPVM